jgi:hypothetical protein
MRGVANNTTNITTAQMTIQRIPVLTPPLPHDSSTRLILQSLQTSQVRKARWENLTGG